VTKPYAARVRTCASVTLMSGALAAALSMAPTAAAQSAPCDPASEPSVRFIGLPTRVITGEEEQFRFGRTPSAESRVPAAPYRVRMIDPRGRAFFERTLERLTDPLSIRLKLNDRGVHTVELTYTELDNLSGAQCERLISRGVRPQRLIVFPTDCYSPPEFRRRPRSAIVDCFPDDDYGRFQLKRMRWRGWNREVARGRGLAWVNDCIPDCAEGTFRYYPVRVWLSQPRYCFEYERYVYSRLRYSYPNGSATVLFPCWQFSP
jgi:hypothetical protein